MNPEELIKKYYAENPDAFDKLMVHSTMVKNKALKVVDDHPELLADREFVESAAMLHDIGIIFTNAPSIGCNGSWPYIAHGHLGAELLRKEGYPFHARVCERHTGTGLTREEVVNQNLPIPPSRYVPETIEELIICYADKFYSKGDLTYEHSVDEVLQNLSRYGEDKNETFLKWHEMFK
ncbi:HDIG domain-containing metalloprotein [Saccharicrinis sp. FJH2]|uniref:HDIG domain-containing metalloprotein n=1 Tax=Saccharicrinis sp. FJH65 TaxID=3344659 RepID=UPI0035F41F38